MWAGLRADTLSRNNTPELFTVLMQTMDRQTIMMQRVHHVLVVAFHLLMSSCIYVLVLNIGLALPAAPPPPRNGCLALPAAPP